MVTTRAILKWFVLFSVLWNVRHVQSLSHRFAVSCWILDIWRLATDLTREQFFPVHLETQCIGFTEKRAVFSVLYISLVSAILVHAIMKQYQEELGDCIRDYWANQNDTGNFSFVQVDANPNPRLELWRSFDMSLGSSPSLCWATPKLYIRLHPYFEEVEMWI